MNLTKKLNCFGMKIMIPCDLTRINWRKASSVQKSRESIPLMYLHLHGMHESDADHQEILREINVITNVWKVLEHNETVACSWQAGPICDG